MPVIKSVVVDSLVLSDGGTVSVDVRIFDVKCSAEDLGTPQSMRVLVIGLTHSDSRSLNGQCLTLTQSISLVL